MCGEERNSCAEDNVDICSRCAKVTRPKTKSNTSGFVGVGYIQPRERKNPQRIEQGFWYGKIMLFGKRLFKVEYKDSYEGTDGYKKLTIAISRDIHIKEHNLNHFRNFTNEELMYFDTHGISLNISDREVNEIISHLKIK